MHAPSDESALAGLDLQLDLLRSPDQREAARAADPLRSEQAVQSIYPAKSFPLFAEIAINPSARTIKPAAAQ